MADFAAYGYQNHIRYCVHSDTDAQRIALSQIAIATTVPIGTETHG
jgi:hypothetical protein